MSSRSSACPKPASAEAAKVQSKQPMSSAVLRPALPCTRCRSSAWESVASCSCRSMPCVKPVRFKEGTDYATCVPFWLAPAVAR